MEHFLSRSPPYLRYLESLLLSVKEAKKKMVTFIEVF